jgi:hypothetical protein
VRWGAHVPKTDTLGYAGSEHDDTHHIHMNPRYSQLVLFRGPAVIDIEANRFRLRLIAIQKHVRLRTVLRCWDEPLCGLVPMPIMAKLLFRLQQY